MTGSSRAYHKKAQICTLTSELLIVILIQITIVVDYHFKVKLSKSDCFLCMQLSSWNADRQNIVTFLY